MSSEQQRKELDDRARKGETVVPGGTGGKSYQAQQQLAQGRSKGGQTRREQLGTQGYQELGRKGGLSTGTTDQKLDVDESTGFTDDQTNNTRQSDTKFDVDESTG